MKIAIDGVTVEMKKKGQSKRVKENGLSNVVLYRHNLVLTFKSKKGFVEDNVEVMSQTRKQVVTEAMLLRQIRVIFAHYDTTEEHYPTFQDYIKEFPFNEKETYKSTISFNKNLHNIVSKDWFDSVSVALTLMK